ncbi:MAG: hypothetical protein J5666_00890 [Bacilli bacterium]|nr:hypothetical protein [Bacilli bacterium]
MKNSTNNSDYIIIKSKYGQPQAITKKNISGYVVTSIKRESMVPIMAGKTMYIVPKKNPTTYGTIMIGYNSFTETTIEKKNYFLVLKIFKHITIRNVINLFEVEKELKKLKMQNDVVLLETLTKKYKNKNKVYTKTTIMTSSGKITSSQLEINETHK